MPHIATYLTYREHVNDVPKYREAKRQQEAARKVAFRDKVLTPEELNVAKKRGEILKRTIDSLDEYSQSKMEDVESVTQTVLGESISLLTAAGAGIGKLYQSTQSGQKLTQKLASKMGKYKSAAPAIIPGTAGLLFAITSSIPLLFSLSTIEVQTPRMARFETLKGELSNAHDFAILTDEQTNQAKEKAKTISVPEPKPTEKSLLSSLNIFSQLKSYMGIVAKRTIYRKDKADFETRQNNKYIASHPDNFTQQDLEKADETREITQRLVNKIDLESQDYTERVFKALDVVSMGVYALGVAAFWVMDKGMNTLKIKNSKIKNIFSVAAALAGIIALNSKVAEYRNNAIRIARHKQLNEMLEDPTNFLKTPELKNKENIKVEEPKKQGIIAFLKTFYKDLHEYDDYTKTKMVEDKKFRIAARGLDLTPEQLKDAKLRQMNFFKMINKADDNRSKFEEKLEVLTMQLSTPMGLMVATLGSAFGWALHKFSNAPKSHKPIYSTIGAIVGLVPAIGIELFTTIEERKAARVAYMKAQEQLADKKIFLDYSQVKTDDNQFLRMSFKNSKVFSKFN